MDTSSDGNTTVGKLSRLLIFVAVVWDHMRKEIEELLHIGWGKATKLIF